MMIRNHIFALSVIFLVLLSTPLTALATPVSVSNLYAWWKADSITGLTNGQAVTTWVDSSNNALGLNLGQTSGSLDGGTYSATGLNGKPAVALTAVSGTNSTALASSSSLQTQNDFGLTGNPNYTLFMVFQFNTSGTVNNYHQHPFQFGSGGGNGQLQGIEFEPSGTNRRLDVAGGFGQDYATAAVGPWSGNYILEVTYSGLRSTTQVALDGATVTGTGPNSTLSLGSGKAYVGLWPSISNGFNGLVAEIIVYDRALLPSEKAVVGTYLAQKYDLAYVPEPHSLAMGLCGLALMGLVPRRKRTAGAAAGY